MKEEKKKDIIKKPSKKNFIDLLEKAVDIILSDPDKLKRASPITAPNVKARHGILKKRDTVSYKSDYTFLQELNGWRKGEVHVVLGDKGDGKSTFSRSILLDLLKNGHRPLIYLSEDEAEDYLTDILGRERHDYDNQIAVIGEKNQLSHLKVSEEPIEQLLKTFVIYLEVAIKIHEPDFLVIDNISTSVVFDENDKKAVLRFYTYLHRIATLFEIPVLFFSHVKSDLKRIPYKVSDVRGNKSLINMTENTGALYKVLRPSHDGGDAEIRSAFHWIVTRKQKCSTRKYMLTFDKDTAKFGEDAKLTEGEFQQFYVQKPKWEAAPERLDTLKKNNAKRRAELKHTKLELDLEKMI